MRSTKPTIDDVARAAGVSRTTVSRVLNNKPGVSWPVRQRVLQAAAELHYQPNENARALASGRQRAVDLTSANYCPELALGEQLYYYPNNRLPTANVHLHIQVIAKDHASERIDPIAADTVADAILANITPDLALRLFISVAKSYP